MGGSDVYIAETDACAVRLERCGLAWQLVVVVVGSGV